ncbi:AT-hook motif nuclear-localized protein 6 isoform X2 [Rutidosis leptorrhynchoides]|uniref:AT-hook motif nuclear-localized protein 6 isoform X2 n=1 Tax=Rutidosis leptorrhynchoides TaxID=125765 RepID=UPI003A990FC7
MEKSDKQNHESGQISVQSPVPAVVVSREEISIGSTVAPAPPPPPPPADSVIKKRGRPRKYGPDGKPTATLSPMPISASIPITGDYTGWKRNQGKPLTSVKRKQKLDFCTPVVGQQMPYLFGANFKPHVLTVISGEIISFAQQGAGALCILAANGAISNVTLRQPNSSGGTLTYEGHFDILSLSGAFTSNENGGVKGMSGGMSVSLACPDGRVLGGGLAGMLVAAGPVQVILGSFIPGHQLEPQKLKKSRFEHAPTISPPNVAAMPIFMETSKGSYSGEPKIGFTLTGPTNVSSGLEKENNGSVHTSEPKAPNTSLFGVSC